MSNSSHEKDSAELLGWRFLQGSCSIFHGCHAIVEVTLRLRNWRGILTTATRIAPPLAALNGLDPQCTSTIHGISW
jgi:hypothetical protein